jgi:uncharacterized protein YjbJ (UPF0337 family)
LPGFFRESEVYVNFRRSVKKEEPMDRQRIEGRLKKATGSIKEKDGKAIGDRHLEDEGKAEKAEGHIRSGVGKAIDADARRDAP